MFNCFATFLILAYFHLLFCLKHFNIQLGFMEWFIKECVIVLRIILAAINFMLFIHKLESFVYWLMIVLTIYYILCNTALPSGWWWNKGTRWRYLLFWKFLEVFNLLLHYSLLIFLCFFNLIHTIHFNAFFLIFKRFFCRWASRRINPWITIIIHIWWYYSILMTCFIGLILIHIF